MNKIPAVMLALWTAPLFAGDLAAQFAAPPADCRPSVYWFWNNGNVTRAGIRADLEAMKRAGIGGVVIMDVVERFAPPPGTADFMKGSTGKVVLDLGDVAVMAQATLNGHDLGILWKAPFTADVTGLVVPGANTLEVRVANLWPNRMIGDAGLPPEKRFTWSSYEPFTRDSPLPPSGLLGPVRLLSFARKNG